ncbi:ribosomal protein L7/L12 [Actinomadura hibisca]|uniref:ribosomal protein L7/L12 n=1 Tax=Actinomadura hibisca TaxID=68565 RepID=UPI0009FBEE96|nr:ribosomal protein L7/L12 [Actinomadura hibisca]
MPSEILLSLLILGIAVVMLVWGERSKRAARARREELFGKGAVPGAGMPPHVEARALELISQGLPVQAVKEVRQETGLSLKDAKDYVDALKDGRPTLAASVAPPAPWERVPAAARDRAARLLAQNRKIQAVKEVREATGMGLKEAKDYVDALEAGRVPRPPRLDGSLSDRVRAFKAAENLAGAVALVRAETGMSREEAERFVDALD